jgi:hypothetical protein
VLAAKGSPKQSANLLLTFAKRSQRLIQGFFQPSVSPRVANVNSCSLAVQCAKAVATVLVAKRLPSDGQR